MHTRVSTHRIIAFGTVEHALQVITKSLFRQIFLPWNPMILLLLRRTCNVPKKNFLNLAKVILRYANLSTVDDVRKGCAIDALIRGTNSRPMDVEWSPICCHDLVFG